MHSIDITAENFQIEVMDKSTSVPVLVDFWAEWCQPCQQLKPVLEKLAKEYDGKFILAKINADSNQDIATQFAVRGIPSVKAIYDRKIINEFSGVLPEAEIRKFLDLIIPNKSEALRLEALALYTAGETDNALVALDKAIELDENNLKAKVDKAEIVVGQGEVDLAESIVNTLPASMQHSDTRVKEIKTKIGIANRSKALPSKESLLTDIEKNPSNLQLKIDLATVFIAEQNYDSALDILFETISKDRHFADGIARKTVLEIFTLLDPKGDLLRSARKKLASLLN